MIRIAIFASGSGSNARKLFEYFQNHPSIRVGLLISDRRNAGAFGHAAEFQVETCYFHKSVFQQEPEKVLEKLQTSDIDFLLLAGFLLLVPPVIVSAFDGKILNIHPAMLPQFGGKGMYGHYVHEAVQKAGISFTGMTIHEVNQQFDEGRIIFQARCPVLSSDSVSDIAARVLALEHAHYPFVAEQFILNYKKEKHKNK